jgi:hypothetical protein
MEKRELSCQCRNERASRDELEEIPRTFEETVRYLRTERVRRLLDSLMIVKPRDRLTTL